MGLMQQCKKALARGTRGSCGVSTCVCFRLSYWEPLVPTQMRRQSERYDQVHIPFSSDSGESNFIRKLQGSNTGLLNCRFTVRATREAQLCTHVCISVNCIIQVQLFSRVLLFVTPWTVAAQAPLSVGFSRQEYYSGFPFPSPGDLHKPGNEPVSPVWQADSLPSESPGKPI